MKKTILLKSLTVLRSSALLSLPLWGLGGFSGCATTNHSNAAKQTANTDAPPVYYTGNDEPAGFGVFMYADDLIKDK